MEALHKLSKNMSEELEEGAYAPEAVQPEVEQEVSPEQVETKVEPVDKELEARRQLTARAKKAEAEAKVLEAQLKAAKMKNTLDVEDYIDISASLEGLDQREKQYLAEQHKMTGKPLNEIRQDENFNLWQSAYRAKVEKEKLSLRPSGTQSESDRPMSFTEKLRTASIAEKEELLKQAGLYKSPRPRQDRVDLGRGK